MPERDAAAAAFKAFEAAGWSARAATYGAFMARATAHARESLLAGVAAGTRVLDVGSGLGDLAAAAASLGADVTGVDLSDGMLAAARDRHPALSFVAGDAEDLPFDDGAFDVVIGAFVINHLPHPERGVAEMRRVAKRRLSLAMWAEETAMFALVDGPSDAPPGPDAEHFARRENLEALLPGEVTEVEFVLEVPSFDALHDGLAGGTVRTAARLQNMPREALRDAAEPYRRGDGYALPTVVRVVSATLALD
jgi:SAM-dependent methyltransferase